MCDAIRSTWNDKIARDLQGHGTAIFVNFLSAHPEEQQRFTKFASVPAGSLGSNKDLQDQAVTVMKKLGEVINAGDLKAATRDLAHSHKAMNITLPNFKKMFAVIVDYAVAKAGADRAAWTAALDAIGAAISSQQ